MSLLNQLFTKRWKPFHTKQRTLHEATQAEAYAYPGVYLIAYTRKRLDGQRIRPQDVFYVGMTNSAGGLRSRLRQFQNSLEGRDGHGPAYRFFLKCAKGREYSRFQTKNRFLFAVLPVRCTSRKSKAKPLDFVKMGAVAALEYEAVARVLRNTGRLPPLYSLAKDALDHVS